MDNLPIQIPARAFIEKLSFSVDGSPIVGLAVYSCEVQGQEPYDYARKYTIRAKSEEAAFREAMEKFDTEIRALLKQKA